MKRELTAEEEVIMKKVREEWIHRAHNTNGEIDKPKFEKGIKWLYEDILKLEKPSIVYCDSWIDAIMQITLAKKQDVLKKKVEEKVKELKNYIHKVVFEDSHYHGSSVYFRGYRQHFGKVTDRVVDEIALKVEGAARKDIIESFESGPLHSVRNLLFYEILKSVPNDIYKMTAESEDVIRLTKNNLWHSVLQEINSEIEKLPQGVRGNFSKLYSTIKKETNAKDFFSYSGVGGMNENIGVGVYFNLYLPIKWSQHDQVDENVRDTIRQIYDNVKDEVNDKIQNPKFRVTDFYHQFSSWFYAVVEATQAKVEQEDIGEEVSNQLWGLRFSHMSEFGREVSSQVNKSRLATDSLNHLPTTSRIVFLTRDTVLLAKDARFKNEMLEHLEKGAIIGGIGMFFPKIKQDIEDTAQIETVRNNLPEEIFKNVSAWVYSALVPIRENIDDQIDELQKKWLSSGIESSGIAVSRKLHRMILEVDNDGAFDLHLIIRRATSEQVENLSESKPSLSDNQEIKDKLRESVLFGLWHKFYKDQKDTNNQVYAVGMPVGEVVFGVTPLEDMKDSLISDLENDPTYINTRKLLFEIRTKLNSENFDIILKGDNGACAPIFERVWNPVREQMESLVGELNSKLGYNPLDLTVADPSLFGKLIIGYMLDITDYKLGVFVDPLDIADVDGEVPTAGDLGPAESHAVRREINEKVGEIFGELSNIYLDYCLFSTSNFFWVPSSGTISFGIDAKKEKELLDQLKNLNTQINNVVNEAIREVIEETPVQEIRQTMNEYSSYVGFSNYGWVSFYDFFERIGVLKNEDFTNYRQLIESGVFECYEYKNVVFAIRPPKKILKNEQGQLHSTTESAFEFPDGSDYCFINGRSVPSWIVKNPELITKEKFLTEPNNDLRGAMYTVLGQQKMFDLLGAKEVMRKHANNEDYILYETQDEDPELGKLKWVGVQCPSTGTKYLLGVPPETTCPLEGVAGTFGLSASQYKLNQNT